MTEQTKFVRRPKAADAGLAGVLLVAIAISCGDCHRNLLPNGMAMTEQKKFLRASCSTEYVVEYRQRARAGNGWVRCVSHQETVELAREHAARIGVKKYRLVEVFTRIEETILHGS